MERIETTPPPACQYVLSRETLLASVVIEDVESSASYLRITWCNKRFEVLAVIALEMTKWT